jgi:hypothetical protein
MLTKESFTPEEWAKISHVPFLVSLAIGVSDASGPFGMAKEGMALARSVQDALDGSAGEVAKEIATSMKGHRPKTSDLTGGARSADDVGAHATDEIKAAVALVASKDAAEGASLKTWLSDMAQHIAEAAKEGGFLGIGGSAISADEQKALDAIKAALA